MMPVFISNFDTRRPAPNWNEKILLNIVKLWLGIQNGILYAVSNLLYSKIKSDAKRILIFRTGSLGDNICAGPAIAAIRRQFPEARITVLADASTVFALSIENVLSASLYDEVIDYLGMPKKDLLRLLQKKNFDGVIQLPQRETNFRRLLRDLLFFRMVATSGWGWKVSSVRFFKKVQERFVAFASETENLLSILKENRVGIDRPVSFPLNIVKDDETWVQNLFLEKGLAGKEVIAVAIGAQWGLKRWPVAYFKEVLEHFSESYSFILVGSKGDAQLSETLEAHNVVNFCGSFTPMQSAAALKRCLVTISNDTGPMHLSYAVGTPVVGIFSSRDFGGKWYPPNDGLNKVLRAENIHCSICFSTTCSNNICMQAIGPEQVIAAVDDILSCRKKRQVDTIQVG